MCGWRFGRAAGYVVGLDFQDFPGDLGRHVEEVLRRILDALGVAPPLDEPLALHAAKQDVDRV
jgi:hypothetical protein